MSSLLRRVLSIVMTSLACAPFATAAPIPILFVGNSYTFGRVDPVMSYNAANVHDLTASMYAANSTGANLFEPHPWGGVAGIFKQFTVQAGLDYDVSMSARNAASLRGQLLNTNSAGWDLRGNIGSQAWGKVVLQEQSDESLTKRPGLASNPDYFRNYPTRSRTLCIRQWRRVSASATFSLVQPRRHSRRPASRPVWRRAPAAWCATSRPMPTAALRPICTCGWRIRSLTGFARARQCCAGRRSSHGWPDARHLHSRHPPAGHDCDTAPARWPTWRRCGVVVAEASAAHQQSRPPSRVESHRPRSRGVRADHAVREPAPNSEAWRVRQAGNAVQVPPSLCGSEIPPTIFLPLPSSQIRIQRSLGRTHRGNH